MAPAATARRAVSPVTRLSSISDVPLKHDAVGRDALARPHQQAVVRLAAPRPGRAPVRRTVEAMRELGLERREIAGDRAGLAPHRVVERASAQQEEQQHHGGIEIGVLGM